DELHVLEHAGTIGHRGERKPRDRRRIRGAAIGDGPDHTATTVALPRRTAEVIRDLRVGSRVGVQRRRRIYEDPTRAVPAVDLDADAECAKHERTAHR